MNDQTVLTVAWRGQYAGTFSQKKILWESWLAKEAESEQLFLDGARGALPLNYNTLCRFLALNKDTECACVQIRNMDGNCVGRIWQRSLNAPGIFPIPEAPDGVIASSFRRILSGYLRSLGHDLRPEDIPTPTLVDEENSAGDAFLCLAAQVNGLEVRVSISAERPDEEEEAEEVEEGK